MTAQNKYYSDFLVIGSGIAGLAFAIKASEIGSVNIVTKKQDRDSNTNYAQGGIASVISGEDTFKEHIDDTLKAGAGLCNQKAVRILVHEGPERVKELINWGTKFTYKKNADGKHVLDLGREGGHSRNRVVHAEDLTGREIESALLAKISTIKNIRIFENHTAIDLLTEHQLRLLNRKNPITCYGAYIFENSTGAVHIFNSKITLLATGGVGQVYLHTTNPDIATGDGITMAYRAGALISDMEFYQFHPTSFYSKKHEGKAFLISEAVRGEGGILINAKNKRIMETAHPLKDLAPRDIVARAIDMELKKSGAKCVYLDVTFKGKKFLKSRFPGIFEHCLSEGIDISKVPIPVVPAAHFLCGGIVSDINGRTSIRNLYVSGESACTGVHGANRLASNSLLEGIVFSHRAFLHSANILKNSGKDIRIPAFPAWSKAGTFGFEEWVLIQHNLDELKWLMWDYVGIERTDLRLQRAYRRIAFLEEEILDYYKRSTLSSKLIELRNLAAAAKLIILSAMLRKESRGLHYNTDYPKTRNDQKINIIHRSRKEAEKKLIKDFIFS
ncbi:MAG: L-aspartate oxidase [Spirochaetes bacterium]|nr:L-aspartate oxidase [Spirochaetota bacterium]